jgi:multiple sugar transport system ATP-binding protein
MNLVDGRQNGAAVRLGVRAEDVEVSTSAIDGWQSARAVVVEPMGNETLITIDYRAERVVARVAAHVAIEPGQPLWVNLPEDRVLVFDAASGRLRDSHAPVP